MMLVASQPVELCLSALLGGGVAFANRAHPVALPVVLGDEDGMPAARSPARHGIGLDPKGGPGVTGRQRQLVLCLSVPVAAAHMP
jgi:hypothetical protein